MLHYRVVMIKRTNVTHFLFRATALIIEEHPFFGKQSNQKEKKNIPVMQIDHLFVQVSHYLLKPPHVRYSTLLYSLCWINEWFENIYPAGGGSFTHQAGLIGQHNLAICPNIPPGMKLVPNCHQGGSTKMTGLPYKNEPVVLIKPNFSPSYTIFWIVGLIIKLSSKFAGHSIWTVRTNKCLKIPIGMPKCKSRVFFLFCKGNRPCAEVI